VPQLNSESWAHFVTNNHLTWIGLCHFLGLKKLATIHNAMELYSFKFHYLLLYDMAAV